jgi:hypothetical protein
MSKRKLKYVSGYCAPHALHFVSGKSENTVYEACLNNDFSKEFGMEEYEWQKAAKELGVRLRRKNLKRAGLYGCQLKDFIKACPEGMYIIYTHMHLFVVEDGEIYDLLNPNNPGLSRLVTGAWRVLNPK